MNQNLYDENHLVDFETKQKMKKLSKKMIKNKKYTAGSLIVTVFFGLTPVISRPNTLAVFSLDTIGSDEKTDPKKKNKKNKNFS